MLDGENTLRQVLAKIAKEQNYDDYETELSVINSGGANYTSQLFSVTLTAPRKDDLNLFAKVAVLSEKFRSMITLKVFDTEIMFYTTVVTKYRELEERYNFPQETRLVLPKYYGGSTEYLKESLVLEELTRKGYQPFDRFKCFNWEYASKCLNFLARLHALSVAYERDEPEQFADMVQKLVFQPASEEMKSFIEKAVAKAIEMTSDEYKEKLQKYLQENMTDENFMSYYNPERKVVLNHGDFRPSNVMHKRDENGKVDVVVIDYQVLQKGNPVTDLLFFFISGSDEQFRQKYRWRYFDHYYQEFSATLRRLKMDPDEVYSKEDFDADVEKIFKFGLVLGVMSLPFITVDEDEAPRLEDGIDLDSFDMKPSDLFGTRLNGLLRDYVSWGML